MPLDFSNSYALREKINEHSRSANLALYAEAQERGLSFSELLEELDPTPRRPDGALDSPLDAFERQLYLAGIVTSGRNATTLEHFLTGAGLILAPEYVSRELHRGYRMVQDPAELVAAAVPERGPSVKPIYIKTDSAKKPFARRSETASYPVVKLVYREKDAAMVDRGRQFDFSYRVLKNQKLAEFRVFLNWIGAELAFDEITEIYNIAINGDGASPAPANSFNGTAGTFGYSDLTHLALSFGGPARMTHLLGTKADIEKILNIPEFQDPQAFQGLQSFHQSGDYRSFLPVNTKLVVCPGAVATKFAALDHRFAIRESVAQPLLIEAEKVISQKLESAVISKESVYTIMVDDAVAVSDY
ncbi:hypothetical protein EHM69_04285 [candidate division KSB1 bacterium]|nr:MAG: hypothetical protein EHM69_04285 [candidate division KSB1 bacterium]